MLVFLLPLLLLLLLLTPLMLAGGRRGLLNYLFLRFCRVCDRSVTVSVSVFVSTD